MIQIQIQKQKQKYLTFEEICPRWAEAIRNERLSEGLGVYAKYCVVGEAHGFSMDYALKPTCLSTPNYCPECVKLSGQLVNYDGRTSGIKAYAGIYGDPLDHIERNPQLKIYHKRFERLREMFVDHWNEKHVFVH